VSTLNDGCWPSSFGWGLSIAVLTAVERTQMRWAGLERWAADERWRLPHSGLAGGH
jgi:hypothetical protein